MSTLWRRSKDFLYHGVGDPYPRTDARVLSVSRERVGGARRGPVFCGGL